MSNKTWFDLLKSGKSGLVAKKVQITRNGKTFQQTVYVRTGDDPDAQQPTSQPDQPKSDGNFSLDEFNKLRGNKPDALRYLDANGVTWEKTPHPGVNWMRATMAAKKHGGSGNTSVSQVDKPKQKTQPQDQPKQQDTSTGIDLDALKKKHGDNRAAVLKELEGAGVTWKKHSNEGINWMRANMAAKTHSGTSTEKSDAKSSKETPEIAEKQPEASVEEKEQTESEQPKESKITHSEAVTKSLESIESVSRKKQTHEFFSGIDSAGKTVFKNVRGEYDLVNISHDDMEEIRGGILTHNHPLQYKGESVTLSMEDIKTMKEAGLSEIRAVNSHSTTAFARDGDRWNDTIFADNQLWNEFKIGYQKIYRAGQAAIKAAGKVSAKEHAEIWEKHTKEQIKYLQDNQQKYGYRFQFESELSTPVPETPDKSQDKSLLPQNKAAKNKPEVISDSSSTGEIIRDGDKVYKNTYAVGLKGNRDNTKPRKTQESEVYDALAGNPNVLQGKLVKYKGKDMIETPYVNHIISTDTIPKERRSSVGRIVSQHLDGVVNAVNALTNAGYSYSDPLQFGLQDNKLKLFDFSNAHNRYSEQETMEENYGALTQFLKDFGQDGSATMIRTGVRLFGIVQSTDVEDLKSGLHLISDEELEPVTDLMRTGVPANNLYYSRNARMIQGKFTVGQTEPINGVKYVTSEQPLTAAQMEEWELKPIYVKSLGSYSKKEVKEAYESWFEYENANLMKEYSATGKIDSTTDMSGTSISPKRRAKLIKDAKALQHAAESSKIQEHEVWRGMVMESEELVTNEFTKHGKYTFNSLTASTVEKKLSNVYMDVDNYGGGEGVPVRICIKDPSGVTGYKQGAEVIIPKGAVYNVTDIRYDEKDTLTVYLSK